jgi:hypothetical protein
MLAASQELPAAVDSDSNRVAAAVICPAVAPDCDPDVPVVPGAVDVPDPPDCGLGWLNCGYCGTGAPILASSAIATASSAGVGPDQFGSAGSRGTR